MIKSIHRRRLPEALTSSSPLPITTMNTAAFTFSRHNRTALASFWLCVLLFLLGTSHLPAQLTPFDDLPVMVLRPLGSDQFTEETGTFYADGSYVSNNNPQALPLSVLGWSQAQFAAVYGKPLFPADDWFGGDEFIKFRHSTETYNWITTPLYIISAAGGSAAPVIRSEEHTSELQSPMY